MIRIKQMLASRSRGWPYMPGRMQTVAWPRARIRAKTAGTVSVLVKNALGTWQRCRDALAVFLDGDGDTDHPPPRGT